MYNVIFKLPGINTDQDERTTIENLTEREARVIATVFLRNKATFVTAYELNPAIPGLAEPE